MEGSWKQSGPPTELVSGMSLARKDPPEGPPREAKIDPKSKKCMIFLMSKHGHFLRRLQDQFFVCFGPSRGAKSMDFRVPERLPGQFLWFYAHMQILSPLPCFFKVFQGVKTLKIREKSTKIHTKTELPKKWVPKSIFDPF